MNIAKIVKDDWFTTRKWFIVLETPDGFGNAGYKVNNVGFKTKKAAVAMVEDAAGWTVVDEFEVK